MTKQLQGITTAIVTPLDAAGRFDGDAFDRHLEYVEAGGIDSLLVLGVAGECPALGLETRKQVAEHAKRRLRSRVPLIVGVLGASTDLVLDNITSYAAESADFVLATPPDFLPLSQDGCIDFFHAIADRSPVPVIMYNCPLNRNQVTPETARQLADHPKIAGLKDTTTMIDLLRMHVAVGSRDDFTLLSGHEFLFAGALSLGIDAFVMGGPGNLFPHRIRDVFDRFRDGRTGEAVETFVRLFRFMDELYAFPCGALPAIKGVLSILKLTSPHVARPTIDASDEELVRIRQLMIRSGIFPGCS